MSETAEVEQLRARVAELEAQLAEAPPPRARAGAGRSAWRTTTSGVLIVIACLLAPISVVAVWANSVISDTDRYVETVAPLAKDPAVRQAVANRVTDSVIQSLDVEQLTRDLLGTLATQQDVPPRVASALPGLAVPITSGVESFTRTRINNLMASPQFAQLWAQVNRTAHAQIVRLLEGDQSGAVTAQNNTVTLNLAPIIEQVKKRLTAEGFTLAEKVPVVDKSFVLAQSDSITKAQSFYRLLNVVGSWLAVGALLLFGAGVYLARDRRGALLRGALGVTASMIVIGAGLAIFQMTYVESTPGNILTPEAAGSVFDALVHFLRIGLRAVAVLGVVVALAAFLAGPSPAAARVRAWSRGGIASLRGSAESAGWNPGRAGTWTNAHKRGLQVSILVGGGFVLMFWSQLTVGAIVLVALLVLLLLACVEFLARPGPTAADASAGGAAPQP